MNLTLVIIDKRDCIADICPGTSFQDESFNHPIPDNLAIDHFDDGRGGDVVSVAMIVAFNRLLELLNSFAHPLTFSTICTVAAGATN